MDMEAGKTLTNEEVIRELLELLKKNAMKEQANDVFEICSYVDGLEKKIDSMTEELTNMQNQIKEMQEDNLAMNVQIDKEKHKGNVKSVEQTEPERAEAERVEAEVVYSPMVAEPQEYQYNADAFENYLRDNAANDNKNKEIIMQKDKNVR